VDTSKKFWKLKKEKPHKAHKKKAANHLCALMCLMWFKKAFGKKTREKLSNPNKIPQAYHTLICTYMPYMVKKKAMVEG
jgi:hypothetical protein